MAKLSRKKGTGSVRYRKDIKRWILDYRDKTHKRIQKITLCKSRDEALQKLEEERAKVFLGLDQATGEKGKSPLFDDYAEEWYKRREVDDLALSTLRSYRGLIDNHLKSHFENVTMDAISKVDIKNFVAEKKAGTLNKKTLRHILGVLNQILNEAEDDGVIDISPYPKTKLLKGKQKAEGSSNGKKMKHLEVHEIPIFLNACQSEHDYCLFYTFIFAGPRRGEALALRWKDIDFQNQQIHIRGSVYKGKIKVPKTAASERSIDIGPRHVEILRSHRASRIKAMLKAGKPLTEEDFVFTGTDGKPLDPDNLYHRRFRPILKRTGLNCDIHGLRHTYASLLIAAEHNLKYVQNQLGHANISMTMDTYGHLLKVSHKDAGAKTESWYGRELAKEQKRALLATDSNG